jgi:hypothetical protein
VVAVLVKRIFQLGAPALIAIAGVLVAAIRRRDVMSREMAQILAGVFLPWPLWFIGMSHHAYFHDYELLLAAPFGAAAVGIAIDATTRHLASAPDRSVTRALDWLPWLVVPAILLTGAALQRLDQHRHPLPPTGALPYAAAIGALTPPDAVVLSPEISMVPVYYSRRHVIRGVTDDHWVEVALRGIKGVFPAGPTFLALRPDSLSRFRSSLLRYPVVSHTEDVILLSLPAH